MENTYDMIIKILEDKLGYVLINDSNDDFAITDYVSDSLHFIQFILEIEDAFGLELDDDFLDYDTGLLRNC